MPKKRTRTASDSQPPPCPLPTLVVSGGAPGAESLWVEIATEKACRVTVNVIPSASVDSETLKRVQPHVLTERETLRTEDHVRMGANFLKRPTPSVDSRLFRILACRQWIVWDADAVFAVGDLFCCNPETGSMGVRGSLAWSCAMFKAGSIVTGRVNFFLYSITEKVGRGWYQCRVEEGGRVRWEKCTMAPSARGFKVIAAVGGIEVPKEAVAAMKGVFM